MEVANPALLPGIGMTEMNLMRPVEDTQESLVQDFSLPVLGILTAAAIGDPTGISAAVIPIIVREVFRRVINPLTTRGESKRLYQWGKQAAEGIVQRRLNDCEEFRKDGFFEETPTNRSNFEEIVESTLKKVMDTTEAPKIDYKAYLTKNICFDEDLDMDTFRRVLKYLHELSYRQLCIIKLCKNTDNIDLDSLGNPDFTEELRSILRDFVSLRTEVVTSNNPLMKKLDTLYLSRGLTTWGVSNPQPEITGYYESEYMPGDLIFRFANLDKIPDKDVDPILQVLKK